jgi:hypothetical protein
LPGFAAFQGCEAELKQNGDIAIAQPFSYYLAPAQQMVIENEITAIG